MKDTLLDLEKDAEVLTLMDKWQERVFDVIPQETILSIYCDQEATRGILSLQYLEISGTICKRICLHLEEQLFVVGYYGGTSYNSTAFRTTTESLIIGRCISRRMFDFLFTFVDRTDHFFKYMGILKAHPEAVASWLTRDGLNKTGHWLCRYVAQRYLEGFTQTKRSQHADYDRMVPGFPRGYTPIPNFYHTLG